jgi:hypothetical protein
MFTTLNIFRVEMHAAGKFSYSRVFNTKAEALHFVINVNAYYRQFNIPCRAIHNW